MKTVFDTPVSTTDPAALEAADRFLIRLSSLDRGPEEVLEAAERHPDAAILRLCAAAALLFGQTEESNRAATAHLDAAENGARTPYEASLHAMLSAWRDGNLHDALDRSEQLNLAFPDDLAAMKMTEFHYYALGQHHNGARFRRHFSRFESRHPDQPDFLAMYSFAHELCGDFDRATALAERAIDARRRNPWAEHALSHVLIRQGKPDEGIRRMSDFLPELRTCNRLVYAHDAWHLALLHLEKLDFEAADTVYRQEIWGITPDVVGEQLDAISFLWREEIAGADRSREWNAVADHLEARAAEVFIPFLNAHFAYALARAGRNHALDDLLAAVRLRTARDDREAIEVWKPAGCSVVEASAAAGRGDPAATADLLGPVMPTMSRIGGSDAQDDLFRQAYFVALADSGRKADARTWLEKCNAGKTPTPLDEKLAARAA